MKHIKIMTLFLILLTWVGLPFCSAQAMDQKTPQEDHQTNHRVQAKIFYGQKNYKTAIDHWEKALNNGDTEHMDNKDYLYLGLCYYKEKEYKKVLVYWKKGLDFINEIKENRELQLKKKVKMYECLSMLHCDQTTETNTIKNLTDYIKNLIDYIRSEQLLTSYKMLGEFYFEKNRYEEAIKTFEKIIFLKKTRQDSDYADLAKAYCFYFNVNKRMELYPMFFYFAKLHMAHKEYKKATEIFDIVFYSFINKSF